MAPTEKKSNEKQTENKSAARKAESKDEPSLVDGYESSIGILPTLEEAAAAAEAEARASGVSGQCVMRSTPNGYANGAGQMIDLTGDQPEVTGGNDENPALAVQPGDDPAEDSVLGQRNAEALKADKAEAKK